MKRLCALLLTLLVGCADDPVPNVFCGMDSAVGDVVRSDRPDGSVPDDRVYPDGAWPSLGDAGCVPLAIEPSLLRLSAGSVGRFNPTGGSGATVIFVPADGAMLQGSDVMVGGSVRGGSVPTRFDVVATDAVCAQRVVVHVEVVERFSLEPETVRLAPGDSVRFAVHGAQGAIVWDVRESPASGDGRLDATVGAFTAGAVLGRYRVGARDVTSGQDAESVVVVDRAAVFEPAVALLMVPVGGRVRIDWSGSDGVVDASVVGTMPGGRLVPNGSSAWYEAAGATPGSFVVEGTDRATGRRARQRVVVGERLDPVPVVRGEDTTAGDLAWGDVQGDGVADLIVGMPTYNAPRGTAGAVLVYAADASGALPARPTQVLTGDSTNDLFGTVVQSADLNGDGRADVIAASTERDLPLANSGAVEVFLGGETGLSTTAVRTLTGLNPQERFGADVSVADVNGDMVPDLIVGSQSTASALLRPGECGVKGRVFIYRGIRGSLRVFDEGPWQTLELRVPFAMGCPVGENVVLGRGMAFTDLDGDGLGDLAVGIPAVYGSPRTGYFGSVLVFRGAAGGVLETQPTRWITVGETVGAATFGAGVMALPTGGILVRAPFWNRNASGMLGAEPFGAAFVFEPSTVWAPAGASTTSGAVTVRTTMGARARLLGQNFEGLGRSGALGDVDGDGRADVLLGGGFAEVATSGSARLQQTAALAGAGAIALGEQIRGGNGEVFGWSVAVGAARAGRAAPVAALSPRRDGVAGLRVGAVSVIPEGAPGTLTARWAARATIELPQVASSDAYGTALALGTFGSVTGGDALVGAPGAHSPAVTAGPGTVARAAGALSRTGLVRLTRTNARTPFTSFLTERVGAGLGRSLAVLDFDGDGLDDVAIGDPTANAGGYDVVRANVVAMPSDERCFLRAGGARVDASALNRGVVRVWLQQRDGSFAERFWLWGRELSETPVGGQRGAFGASVASAGDVNGDGRQDLVVGHSPSLAWNGAEVILGRVPVAGRISLACGDPTEAPWWPTRGDGSAFGGLVTSLGDLDADGCSDVGVVLGGGTRGAVSVRYGFGARCRSGHTTPFEMLLTLTQENLLNNVAGDVASRANDLNDRQPANAGFADVLAGGADVTGDGVPDLVVRERSLALGNGTDPGVDVISGAWVVGLCPNRVCVAGLRGPLWADGDYHIAAMQFVSAPHRMILRAPTETSYRFGVSLAVADVDADRVGDVLVGAADDSTQSAWSGAIRVYRGGSSPTQFSVGPWAMAVGDINQPAMFGMSMSARAVPTTQGGGLWLLAGAPRDATLGADVGAAFRFRVPVP